MDAAPKAMNAAPSARPRAVPWQREVLLAVAVVAVAFVGLGFLLEGGVMPYSKHSDLVAYQLPLKLAAYQGLEAGDGLPLWRRDMISGGPALTNPQAVYLNPLQWPFLWLPPGSASGLSYWLHFVCMGLSMLVLGRVLGLGLFARMFIALAGMFCFKGIAIAYAGWLPVLPGFVAAPLLIAGALRALDQPDRGSVCLLAAGGSLVLFSGHLQIPYYLVLFLGAYVAVWAVARVRSGDAAHVRRAISAISLAAVIALASAGCVLLPLAYEVDLLARTASQFGFLQGEGAYVLPKLLTLLHPEALGTPLADDYPGVSLWEDVAYFGALPQLMALFAIFVAWRRRHARFLIVAFLLSILLCFDTFLLRLLHEVVPGFSLFRNPSRFLFLTTLFGIALAGFGVEALMQRFVDDESSEAEADAEAPRPPRRVPAIVAGVLFAVTFYEGASFAQRYLATEPIERVLPPDPGFAAFFARDESVYRVAPLQRAALNYGWARLYGLELVTGYEPHNYRHYQQYMNLVVSGRVIEPTPITWTDLPQVRRWDLLEAIGAKYLISTLPLDPVPPPVRFRERLEAQPIFAFYEGLGTANLFLYEATGARARGVFAREIVRVPDASAAFEALARVNVRRKTVVEAPDAITLPAGPPGTLALRSYGASELVFGVDAAAGGFAVVSEVWHPGWQARVDGASAPILRTNGAFLGVEIPPGTGELALRFEPPGLRAGAGLTVSALAVLLILGTLHLLEGRSDGRA